MGAMLKDPAQSTAKPFLKNYDGDSDIDKDSDEEEIQEE